MSECACSEHRRLASLDALRGFDMVWIMGLAAAVTVLCRFFPSSAPMQWICSQLRHAHGVGFTFYDLIFPLFLFMAGVSWPFSYASQKRRGASTAAVHLRILRRVLVLAALQMLQSGILHFDAGKYTYPSVLIRIALSWALAALVYIHCRPKARIAVAVFGVLAYWAILEFVPSPLLTAGQRFDYTDWTTSHVAWVDRYVSFRAWFGHDPFERMDIPLSVVQVPLALLGMFAGDIVRREGWAPARRSAALAGLGAALAAAGLAFAACGCPIHKNLSTASFMLLTGGLSCLLLALFHYVIDVRGWSGWAFPLCVVGQNSIVAYLLPGLVGFFPAAPLAGALGRLSLCWTVLWLLSRAKIFLKA